MKIIFILFYIFLTLPIRSQPIGEFLSVGVSLKSNPFYRASLDFADNSHGLQVMMIPFTSISMVKNESNKIYISMNPLFSSLIVVNPILMLPNTISNMKFQFKLYQNMAQLVVGQNTDYFLLSADKRIYTEIFIGTKAAYKRTFLGVNGCFPLSKGFNKDKSPYIFAYLSYNLVE